MELPVNKLMATVLWGAQDIINYLQKGRIVQGEFYVNLLGQFNKDFEKSRSHWAKKTVPFTQTINARVHKFAIMTKFNGPEYELLHHPPYSRLIFISGK